ncbi:Cytochrome b561 [Salinihabitans flavidus]|uniref:Cytochrome b561 n=1 Tax=Salinihabitans flavidus TaxID=569882 RepID=A0A1H8Q8I5_9RHOB|nr:cytochrome b/b6 domain-containing protein [Salinihabitans flavidus]SEO50217.1 Cytochrome b561 [Salinihabitans flavidus]
MPLSNSNARYGSVTKGFHWLTALLIVTLIPLGLIANAAPFDTGEELARKAGLFSLHKTLGVTLFFVALLRIVWALTQPRPGLLNAKNRAEALLAETIHWMLYAALVLAPLSGWVHHAATTGFAPIWWPFGQTLPFVPQSEGVAATAAGLHQVFVWGLIAALTLHVAGALKHAAVDRDQTLQRMLPGKSRAPDPGPQRHGPAPVLAALLLWGAAIGIGSGLGAFAHDDTARPTAPQLELAESDWQVQNGTLAITVRQMGSEVTGRFADWTADITFDEAAPDGRHGAVEVTVSIPSLTLGSVTDQALGGDFLAAQEHPTARFTADIVADGDAYVADGTLALKGETVPVTLPFTLKIDGDTATMEGAARLNRRDFGVGEGVSDEKTLGFAVNVDVTLTATRAEAPDT